MPKHDPDQPPADFPLAEAFVRLMQPSAELIEEARRKAAAQKQDWQVCLLQRAVTATTDIAHGRAPPPCGEEAASLLEDFRRLMANDGARATGREGSLLGPEREFSPELWPHIEIRGDGTIEVPGAPPVRFYAVVVGLKKPAKRGAPPKKDARALEEMGRVFQADPTLSVRDRRRIAEQLIDNGWAHDPSVDRESLIRRLVRHFPCKKITD